MTILKIFRLEDSEENPITTLCEGEHFVGRDKLLDCHDRRVSRKHALIHVRPDGVTLTAVHVNPCYFKTSTDTLVQLIKKDSTIHLRNGDQFALLVDMFWYKVKIVSNNEDTGYVYVSKRDLDCSDVGENCKRLKTHNVDEDTNVRNIASISVPRIDTNSLLNNLANIINGDYGNEDSTSILNQSRNNTNGTIAPNSTTDAECPQNENESDHSKVVDNIHNNTTVVNPLENESEHSMFENDIHHNTTIERPPVTLVASANENGVSGENTDIPQEILPGQNAPCDIAIENIKKEVDENEANGSENAVDLNRNSEPSASSNSPSTDNIKREAPDKEDDPQNGDANGPSSSNGTNNTRRDRCWYGQSCYRKNPTHRSNFSHPGDDDYDSDPNDDRPVCPFGAACYRVNMEHRRRFKHFGKPAPKPSNVNIRINVKGACPFCSHCGSNRGKPGYESDYDSDGGNVV